MIISCQKGLRSLYVCEQLARAGYADVAWLSGGFEAADKGDFEAEQGPDVDIRLAGTGGIASVLGWTEVQSRDYKKTSSGALPQQKYINIVRLTGRPRPRLLAATLPARCAHSAFLHKRSACSLPHPSR